jgi:hypothetical protein
MVEKDEGSDHPPPGDRQESINLEPAEVAAALFYDKLDHRSSADRL